MQKVCFLVVLLVFSFVSCKEKNDIPKPYGQIRLTFPKNQYQDLTQSLPYNFKKSVYSVVELKEKQGWINLYYPHLRAKIYLSYFKVENNLMDLISNTEKLTFDKHAVKATEIKGQPFENKEKKTFGTLFYLSGNTATNIQFYLTDSTKHFINGSVYFKVKPNYDSLLPVIKYLEKDVKTIMETTNFK